MRVYHFVDAAHGISNLFLKRLKVSRFDQLNDPFELLPVDLLDNRHRNAITTFKQDQIASKCMICFSAKWFNPVLWGHYAKKHSGMALGFDVPDELLWKVRYKAERVKLNFDQDSMQLVNGEQAVETLVSTKFLDWRYEEEYRQILNLDSTYREGNNNFIGFSESLILREIILGLECDLPIAQIRQALDKDNANIKVLKAKMDPNKFSVIEDCSARRNADTNNPH